MAERFEPRLERLKHLLLREIGKLFAEALEVAEGMLINEADEAEEFEQRVLQRRGRQQQLVFVGERLRQQSRSREEARSHEGHGHGDCAVFRYGEAGALCDGRPDACSQRGRKAKLGRGWRRKRPR